MGTSIYYYSGTGNSLWAARKLSEGLEEARVHSIVGIRKTNAPPAASETLGLVFPVYIWGVPGPVVDFMDSLIAVKPSYFFAVAVNGGQVAGTLMELEKLLLARGMLLSAGFSLVMPSNYIAWGGPGPKEKLERIYRAAGERIDSIRGIVKRRESAPVDRGPLWQRSLLSLAHKLSYAHVPGMDKAFFSDEKCDGCGICAKVCPAENVSLEHGRPVWHHGCEQCFACIQWCPRAAIQAGKKTSRYERYHHPEVTLKDMIASRLPAGG